MPIRSIVRRAWARGAAARLALAAATFAAPQAGDAQPPAPGLRMVTVAPSVELEVLDSGGAGPALLLLAGLGHTAHVHDGWTTRLLRDRFRVIAVTRRGAGVEKPAATALRRGSIRPCIPPLTSHACR